MRGHTESLRVANGNVGRCGIGGPHSQVEHPDLRLCQPHVVQACILQNTFDLEPHIMSSHTPSAFQIPKQLKLDCTCKEKHESWAGMMCLLKVNADLSLAGL